MTKLDQLVETLAGTTIHLVPHFHFDPVWWNTQAASVSELRRSDWSASPRMRFQASAFDILDAHLDLARRDADFRFCVAEVDYLEPYWHRRPERRAEIRALLDADRLEVVGGSYNEPSSNLTGDELTRRNFAEGLAFQRGVLGAEVTTAWQLDVFGHDPCFPSAAVAAGLDAVVFARGPYGPWGPMLRGAFAAPVAPDGVQFPTEFEWIAPDGSAVLGVYLAAHYSTAYGIDECQSWEEAAVFVLELAAKLRPIAATSHVLVPVGTDIAPPARWVTELPRRCAGEFDALGIRCSLPRHFIDAVRAELAATGRPLSPQTRDLNPVYTGKDVSYIDTKQAQRAVECALVEAASWVPDDELAEAWRLLVYTSHHDAITGTESDQVYLELLACWRRAHDVVRSARERALAAPGGPQRPPGAVAVDVHNGVDRDRTDVVRVELADELSRLAAVGIAVVDDQGAALPFVVEADVRNEHGQLVAAVLTVLVAVAAVPGITTIHVVAADAAELPRWKAGDDVREIANEHHRLRFDPARGGTIDSWIVTGRGRELVAAGRLAGELVLVDEHATHPVHGEGPWHLLPRAVADRTSWHTADVTVLTSPVGARAVATTTIGGAGVTATTTLWHGLDRVDVAFDVDAVAGADHLLRACWPLPVAGARPVVETAAGPIGRGFALLHADAAEHPWTLETPALSWFALSSTCRVLVSDGDGEPAAHAVGVAEIVVASDAADELRRARRLAVALAASGVTATTTVAEGDRCGRLGHDSNAPDVRIALRHDDADHRFADELGNGFRFPAGTHWVPADRPLAEVWVPGLDVTGPADLPTVVVSAPTASALDAELDAVVAALGEHLIHARRVGDDRADTGSGLEECTVAVVHRGTPSCAAEPDGTLVSTLQRACSAWPAGQWIDPPRRTAPDGSSFALQHWSHRYELALAVRGGDWRAAGVAATAEELQRPLVAVPRCPPSVPVRPPPPGRTPVFARHWVHGLGPAPVGGPPFTVHLHPPTVGDVWRVTVTATAATAGDLELRLPDGWRGVLDQRRFALAAGAWTATTATVTPPPGATGHHVVRVTARAAHGASYDEHVVSLGTTAAPLELPDELPVIMLVAGGRAEATVTVVNRTDSELTGHVDVLGPWGTWELFASGRIPTVVPAGAAMAVPVSFAAPLDAAAGSWWWACRVVAGALVAHSPSAPLMVRAASAVTPLAATEPLR